MQESIVSRLKELKGDDMVLTGNDLNSRYDHIWNMHKPLSAKAVLLPRSTQDVSDIMRLCYEHDQAVVIHGGLTGLVGGTEVNDHDIVISTERLNRIEEIDEASRTITVQAGVILEDIHRAVGDVGLLFPMNFGAKGSAQIGGVITTNAGGLSVFRYGMTRNLVLGLEVVMSDGAIISSLKKIIKDNAGYNLKHLFIGSEGTLGIITRAVLKLVEAPKSRISVFIALDDYAKVMQLLRYMDAGLAGSLNSFELMWSNTYKALTGQYASVKPPLTYGSAYYVLADVQGSEPQHDEDRLMSLIEEALEQELITDAVFATSQSDLDWFWTVRKDVQAILKPLHHSQNFDISIPPALIGQIVSDTVKELEAEQDVERVYPFGHIADGNIHFIVAKQNDKAELTSKINRIIYKSVQAIGGSISAEHGIGTEKKAYLNFCRSEQEIDLMHTLKKSLDPKNILNPGKVIDSRS